MQNLILRKDGYDHYNASKDDVINKQVGGSNTPKGDTWNRVAYDYSEEDFKKDGAYWNVDAIEKTLANL